MGISKKLAWLSIGAVTGIVLISAGMISLSVFFGASRPTVPPEGVKVSCPWVSIDLEEILIDTESELEKKYYRIFPDRGFGGV